MFCCLETLEICAKTISLRFILHKQEISFRDHSGPSTVEGI
jgi:hypothetical protein